MRRYKYIGKDGSSGYRNGKKYWSSRVVTTGTSGVPGQRIWFIPLNIRRKELVYTSIERFKADWE